jgi:hypothetical protein
MLDHSVLSRLQAFLFIFFLILTFNQDFKLVHLLDAFISLFLYFLIFIRLGLIDKVIKEIVRITA